MSYSLNRTKYLSSTELNLLLAQCTDVSNRDVLLILTALNTGARATELLNIRKSNLDESCNTIFIKGIKGSRDREIPIKPILFSSLQNLRPESDNRLFPISYSRLVQIWHYYRPIHKKFHSLRHTFAIQLYEKTKDIRLVQTALGHKNIMNTMVYADYVYSTNELRKLLL